jgi:predicted nucleic acid-binding protein
LAIVDTSVLLAAADRSEPAHAVCVEILGRRDLDLVIPTLVVAEAAYLVGKRLGPRPEAAFVRGLRDFGSEPPAIDEWAAIADLVERYADLGLGTTDASIAVLADRLDTDLVLTLDRRHFGVIHSPAGRRFRLLPDPIGVHEEPAPYEADPA